jgi:DNA-binding transcriptional regulator YhcF (GntR family)
MLRSDKDLGACLNINQNTVASVYKALEKEGFVKIIQGAGTFVRPDCTDSNTNQISQIMDHALIQVIKTETAKSDIIDQFIIPLLKKSVEPSHCGQVILIGCNYPCCNISTPRSKYITL